MPWNKAPEQNEELLAKAVEAVPEAEPRKMFGCPCYFLNGNMFVGAHEESFILRLSPEDQEAMFAPDPVQLFTPMPGRPMREYVLVPSSICKSPNEFRKWLLRSRDYAKTLPRKEKMRSR